MDANLDLDFVELLPWNVLMQWKNDNNKIMATMMEEEESREEEGGDDGLNGTGEGGVKIILVTCSGYLFAIVSLTEHYS